MNFDDDAFELVVQIFSIFKRGVTCLVAYLRIYRLQKRVYYVRIFASRVIFFYHSWIVRFKIKQTNI